jgi:CHASE2 domain-containing sensor protein
MLEVSVIAMDEASYGELKQDPDKPWDRDLHTALLKQTLDLGARAVVFDIWFADPSADPAVDQRFLDAIQESSGKVVLAGHIKKLVQPDHDHLVAFAQALPPTPRLASAAPWGVADLPLEPDKRVRKHHQAPTYTPLYWKVAEILGETPMDPFPDKWISYYKSIPHRSYHLVLGGTNYQPRGFYSNQVVFVGRFPVTTPSGENRQDVVKTPLTRFSDKGMPGVDVHATMFLNLLRQDWLTEVPRAIEYSSLIGCGLIFGFGLILIRPWVAVWVALAWALAVALTALGFAEQERIWFPWLIVSAIQMPCALGWSVVAHTKWLNWEKHDLERKLAASLRSPGVRHGVRTPTAPDHTLIRCVGSGSYGDVWLARDLVGNYRAVKAIYRDRFPDPVPFEREFRGIQKFSPISRTHPGWVDILHIGRIEKDEGFFYIMEVGDDAVTGAQFDPEKYVPRTLASDLSQRGKLHVDECVSVSLALTDALRHLHTNSLIHRDIKPANVIFVKGAPKFADLGLVTSITQNRENVSFLGTEGYIAPEGPGTPMADIFSLGKLIYEASTGRDRRAFPDLPTALEQGHSDPIAEELYRIVLKACEVEARNRYQTAEELHLDLMQLKERLSEAR